MTKRPRIRDVADRAGVSPSTVSAVLNNTPGARVKDATRIRVKQAASELGYAPHPVARSLRTQKSTTIAFISDVIATTPYAGQIIQGAQEAAWERGYLLIVVNTGSDSSLEQRAIHTLKQQHVAGVLYSTMFHQRVSMPRGLEGFPVVLVDAHTDHPDCAYVVPDEFNSALKAMEELIKAGHSKIAYIFDENDGPAAQGRYRAYTYAMSQHGYPIDPNWVIRTQSDSSGGQKAAHRLLSLPDKPTAIFAFNDQMAAGVYRAARAMDVSIPQDLSVMGFDDLSVLSSELDPGLSTMSLPHYDMGHRAAQILISEIDNSALTGPKRVQILCSVVRRGSVAKPPAR